MPDKQQKAHQESREQQEKEIQQALSKIKNKILVMSGKGGVGKSSVAAYLAVALAKKGYQVGLMDVDLHGPSIPRLLGLKGSIQAGVEGGKAQAVQYLPNMWVISIESLMGENKDMATIWRGPLKIGVIRQFIADIDWRDLDYMILDSPPGTGDEPLTVAQTVPDAKAIIVTTPQELSLADVRKSINFCRQVNMDIMGVVENMSGLICPHCGKTIDLFKAHGGMLTAKKENLQLLGSLPMEPQVVVGGDTGGVDFLDNPDLAFTQAFNKIAEAVESQSGGIKRSDADPPESEAARPETDQTVFAVPVADGKLAAHFGHPEEFAIITVEDGKINGKDRRTPPPHEPGKLPAWLQEQGVNVLIAGGIGERAKQLLIQNGVEVIIGAPMDSPEALVNQYLAGALKEGDNLCDH